MLNKCDFLIICSACSSLNSDPGFVKRYASTTKVFNDFKDAGTFGDIYLIKAHYLRRIGNPGGWFADKKRSGGGPLIDLGVHTHKLRRKVL